MAGILVDFLTRDVSGCCASTPPGCLDEREPGTDNAVSTVGSTVNIGLERILVMRSILVVLFAAALLFPLSASGQDDAEVVDVKAKLKAFKEAMKSKDASVRTAAVQEIASIKDKTVAKALSKRIKDRDADVRAAVGRALGQQGDLAYRGKLIAPMKDFDKGDPKALVGFLEGLEGLPHKSSVDPLCDMIKKVMYRERDAEKPLGLGATKALGKIKDKAAISALIEILGLTNPRAGSGGASVSTQTRAFRGSFKQPVLDGLKYIAGEHFKTGKVWQDWWKAREGRFKIPEGFKDLNDKMEYPDYGYKFRLKRPKKTWLFTRPDSETGVIRVGHPQEGNENAWDAFLLVEAYDTSDYSINNPTAAAANFDRWAAEVGFKKDRNDEPMIKDGGPHTKDVKFCGESAKLWSARGMSASGSVVQLRKYILVRGGLLYTISLQTLSGVDPALEADLEVVLKSFSFMK
jgi:HEAT repeats/PBS lyase HEAT-like repeat